MVVGVGRYFKDIPEVMIAAADRLHFPIITLPWSVPFVEVARAITERIISEQYALLQQSAHIHETLTAVVLKGADLAELARVLAELVGCSITIEDSGFHLLASATTGTVDEAREESILQSRTPPALLAELERQGILKGLRDSVRPVTVPPVPEQGLTLERIVAPIVAGGTSHGYVWLIVEDRPIGDLDMIAIEHAATVAALIILKEKAVHETEQRLKSALLDDILEGHADLRAGLPAKAKRFGYDLGQPQQVLIIRRKEQTSLSSLEKWVRQRLVNWQLPGLLVERGENLVLLTNSSQTDDGLKVARQLWREAREENYFFRVGVGEVYNAWERVSESYEEAQEALRLGPVLLGREVVSYSALGFLPWLRHLPPEAHHSNAFARVMESLADHDEQRDQNLLKTLETYLDCGGNIQEAARTLFLHRNTVRQRLNRIEHQWKLDLNDALTCLNLHIALKERRVRDQA